MEGRVLTSPGGCSKDERSRRKDERSRSKSTVLLEVNRSVGSQPFCWKSTVLLEVNRSVGSQQNCWKSTELLEVNRSVGSQPFCWKSTELLEVNRSVGSQPFCWKSTVLLEVNRSVGRRLTLSYQRSEGISINPIVNTIMSIARNDSQGFKEIELDNVWIRQIRYSNQPVSTRWTLYGAFDCSCDMEAIQATYHLSRSERSCGERS
jgi:hypothetical protein